MDFEPIGLPPFRRDPVKLQTKLNPGMHNRYHPNCRIQIRNREHEPKRVETTSVALPEQAF